MYICEKCYQTFEGLVERVHHDGVISTIHKACPYCGSTSYSDNIKKLNTPNEIKKQIKKRGL